MPRTSFGIIAARAFKAIWGFASGQITERLVQAGQTVRRGQPLMRIDPTDLTLAIRASQETVQGARARATQPRRMSGACAI
jgi:multidrug efflux pump subunit AcrA (membrane-fusion protein)